jgi:hypothetical protein
MIEAYVEDCVEPLDGRKYGKSTPKGRRGVVGITNALFAGVTKRCSN